MKHSPPAKKPGRPKEINPRVHQVVTYLSDDERDALESRALLEQRSRASVLREGIHRGDMPAVARRA